MYLLNHSSISGGSKASHASSSLPWWVIFKWMRSWRHLCPTGKEEQRGTCVSLGPTSRCYQSCRSLPLWGGDSRKNSMHFLLKAYKGGGIIYHELGSAPGEKKGSKHCFLITCLLITIQISGHLSNFQVSQKRAYDFMRETFRMWWVEWGNCWSWEGRI